MQSAFAIVQVSENRMQKAQDTLHRTSCGMQKAPDVMHWARCALPLPEDVKSAPKADFLHWVQALMSDSACAGSRWACTKMARN